MSPFDMLIVRSWSAVVARGGTGLPVSVSEEMRTKGTTTPYVDVAERMRILRAQGALP